jgi:uncharacterized coiled-coil protein SlyX
MRAMEESFAERVRREVENAVKEISANLNEQLKEQFKELTDKIAEQNNIIREQKKAMAKQSDRIAELENEVDELSLRLNDLDQDKIINNVEIQGIPELPNENLNFIVSEVAKTLKIMDSLHGGACFRGRKMKDKPRVVILRLADQEKKVRWIKAKKSEEFKNLVMPTSYSEVANSGGPSQGTAPKQQKLELRIFEQITFRTRQLMYETRQEATKQQFQYVWTKNGKIFVRKDKHTKAVIRINKHSDITTKIVLRGENQENEAKNHEENGDEVGSQNN